MKYAVVTSSEFGEQTFAFPDSIEHARMVAVLSYIRHGDRDWRRVKVQEVRSGFVGTNSINDLIGFSEMKYIVVDSDEAGNQLFMFPKRVNHDRMAEVLSEIEESVKGVMDNFYREPVSAGFTDGKRCFGKSESLGVASDKNDTQILRESLLLSTQ